MSKRGVPPELGDLGGVPIVGESVWMACPRGHVQHLRRPFAINIGADEPFEICGVCWSQWVALFGARQIGPDEVAQIREAFEETAKLAKGDG